jgi:hypothetical protein
MKLTQLASFARNGVACAILALIAAPLSAATIEIGFTGLDLAYDGSAIYDAGSTNGGNGDPADADPLATVDIFVDGSPVANFTTNIAADVYIPDVTPIPVGAGVTNITTPGTTLGYFDVLFGTGSPVSEFILVDLDEVNITYLDVAGIVQFTFGAAVSDVFAQSLPLGYVMGDPVTVTFSAQVVPGSLTSSGNTVTGFDLFGTGSIQGPLVPEPGTCLLAAMGLMAGVIRRR